MYPPQLGKEKLVLIISSLDSFSRRIDKCRSGTFCSALGKINFIKKLNMRTRRPDVQGRSDDKYA
jgi:hypothetical protein